MIHTFPAPIRKLIAQSIAGTCSILFALLKRQKSITWYDYRELAIGNLTYSQFGEDVILARYLRDVDPASGIYVDVGAFDPIGISNTLRLYKQGWHGINIDMDEEKITKFQQLRPRDLNIQAAISNTNGAMQHLRYSDMGTNRLSAVNDAQLPSVLGKIPNSSRIVQTRTLTQILDESSLRNATIHYLNVDCEGHDLAVLQGLDFNRYPPNIISVEALHADDEQEIRNFLTPYGYQLVSSMYITKFFVHRSFLYAYNL